MISPTIPINEQDRLNVLYDCGILYTEKEEEFDQITELAAHITDMPVSLISLVDKEKVWFKSSHGTDISSSKRNMSFCAHAVGQEDRIFIVNDAKNDSRFHDHPSVNDNANPVVFYAGVCLVDKQGYFLGTLCVIDKKANSISEKQIKALQTLSKQVVKLIELRKRNKELYEAQQLLKEKNEDLSDFAGRVSHDMKMPLANMIVTADILKAKYASELDEEAKKYLNYLKDSSFALSDYISGILAYYESNSVAAQLNESFDLLHLLEEIIELLNINQQCEINFPEVDFDLSCNRVALEQIFLNLIGNSLKYNDKKTIVIDIDCRREDGLYFFEITDNGVGIPDEKLDTIFELFSTVGNLDRNGKKGNGIGLSTVKKLILKLGGTILVSSELGKGTTFKFSVKGNP